MIFGRIVMDYGALGLLKRSAISSAILPTNALFTIQGNDKSAIQPLSRE